MEYLLRVKGKGGGMFVEKKEIIEKLNINFPYLKS